MAPGRSGRRLDECAHGVRQVREAVRRTRTKKATAKTRKPAAATTAAKTPDEPKAKAAREELCGFAFRLTAEERDAIHKAAGPAKASKFVRTLTVAAPRNDEAAVKAILKGIQNEA